MHTIERVTAGLDWLTMTLGSGALLDQVWLEKGLRCIDEVVKDGHELEYSNLMGYEGVRAGGCFVGTRIDGHMMQFSGRYADLYYDRTYRYDAHYSRLDAQVTVQFKNMPKRIAKEAYRDATTENETIPITRRRKLWIIVGSDGGDTFYCGSTSADARGRLYNKEVQSEDTNYTRCWRYEVQLRNQAAMGLIGSLQTRPTDRTQFLSDWVAIWWEKRGIHTPWTVDDAQLVIPPIKTLPTDDERKLNWLKHQVSPTVRYLLTKIDKSVILELLGLA